MLHVVFLNLTCNLLQDIFSKSIGSRDISDAARSKLLMPTMRNESAENI